MKLISWPPQLRSFAVQNAEIATKRAVASEIIVLEVAVDEINFMDDLTKLIAGLEEAETVWLMLLVKLTVEALFADMRQGGDKRGQSPSPARPVCPGGWWPSFTSANAPAGSEPAEVNGWATSLKLISSAACPTPSLIRCVTASQRISRRALSLNQVPGRLPPSLLVQLAVEHRHWAVPLPCSIRESRLDRASFCLRSCSSMPSILLMVLTNCWLASWVAKSGTPL
jgi:hypothetical protein